MMQRYYTHANKFGVYKFWAEMLEKPTGRRRDYSDGSSAIEVSDVRRERYGFLWLKVREVPIRYWVSSDKIRTYTETTDNGEAG